MVEIQIRKITVDRISIVTRFLQIGTNQKQCRGGGRVATMARRKENSNGYTT